MRSSHSLDRIAVTFDEQRLIDHAGLLLPATLAQHLGLRVWVPMCIAGSIDPVGARIAMSFEPGDRRRL
jgi:hypothetical protein